MEASPLNFQIELTIELSSTLLTVINAKFQGFITVFGNSSWQEVRKKSSTCSLVVTKDKKD